MTENKHPLYEKLWKKLHLLKASEKLELVLKNTPSESLIRKLSDLRGKGRNDYPIENLWIHLIQKLTLGRSLSPLPDYVFSRFLNTLLSCLPEVNHLLNTQLKMIYSRISSFATKLILVPSPKENSDLDYLYIFDGDTGLPILRKQSSKKEWASIYSLLDEVKSLFLETHRHRDQYLIADWQYDQTEFFVNLWNRYEWKPIIEKNPLKGFAEIEASPKNIIRISSDGNIYCGFNEPMVCIGFEKGRNSLKFRCFALHYGTTCKSYEQCTMKKDIRIPLNSNPRLFTPLFHSTYKWKKLYSFKDSHKYFHEYLKSSSQIYAHYSPEKKDLLDKITFTILYGQVLGVQSCK